MVGNRVPTQVVDKNGKTTTVYKNPDKGSLMNRVGKVIFTRANSGLSKHDIQPIVVGETNPDKERYLDSVEGVRRFFESEFGSEFDMPAAESIAMNMYFYARGSKSADSVFGSIVRLVDSDIHDNDESTIFAAKLLKEFGLSEVADDSGTSVEAAIISREVRKMNGLNSFPSATTAIATVLEGKPGNKQDPYARFGDAWSALIKEKGYENPLAAPDFEKDSARNAITSIFEQLGLRKELPRN